MCNLKTIRNHSVQFSLAPWSIGSSGGHEERFRRDPLPVPFAGSPRELFGYGQGCPLFDVVHPAFPLLTTASPTRQGALKGGFEEAVVACDMPISCKLPSLDSCLKRFLLTHNKVDLASHPVVGLVLQVGDTKKFPPLVSKAWIFSSGSASRVHVSQSYRNMEVTRDLQSLNLLAKLMVLHRRILFSLSIAATAEVILMQNSAKQVPSLHGVAPKLVTSSNVWPFKLISALILSALLVIIFFVRTSIPYAVALSTSLSVKSCSSPVR